jgi:hypothetical protein
LADERTSETSCQDVSALKQNENAVEEESTIYQKNPDLDNEENKKHLEAPGKLCNSSACPRALTLKI